MVRDLGKERGKEIDLIVEGGEILADKRIVEEMKDPLPHIPRDALAHRLATVIDRVALGKSPRATIRLKGYTDRRKLSCPNRLKFYSLKTLP
jgi:two-component system chemotaxis sensor kinase CheA